MARKIPYIDTTVAVAKTVVEIEAILQAHKVDSVKKDFENGKVKSLAFKHGDIPFQLPANTEALYQYLLDQRVNHTNYRYRYRYPDQEAKTRLHDQAERCAWRNVMFWVKGQLAMVEIGMVTVTEVFLPYMLMDGQETLYHRMLADGLKALPSGERTEVPDDRG